MALIDVSLLLRYIQDFITRGDPISSLSVGILLRSLVQLLEMRINEVISSTSNVLQGYSSGIYTDLSNRIRGVELSVLANAGLSQAKVDAEINDALTIYDGIIANQEAAIIDYINGIYTELHNADQTVGGKITAAVDESASMLSEAADTAYNTLENSFSTVGSSIMVAVNGVSDYLSGGIDAVYNGLAELVQDVINIPAKLIDKAIELLVPAEALAWTAKMANFIIGQPMTSLMIIIGNMLNGVFGNVFKFDEEDFKEGIKTAMLFISDQTQKAMYTAPGD